MDEYKVSDLIFWHKSSGVASTRIYELTEINEFVNPHTMERYTNYYGVMRYRFHKNKWIACKTTKKSLLSHYCIRHFTQTVPDVIRSLQEQISFFSSLLPKDPPSQ